MCFAVINFTCHLLHIQVNFKVKLKLCNVYSIINFDVSFCYLQFCEMFGHTFGRLFKILLWTVLHELLNALLTLTVAWTQQIF